MAGAESQSLYLTMRDGVRIAVDVSLPADRAADSRMPTLMMMTRYWRSFALRPGDRPGKVPMGPRARGFEDYWIAHGYAVVRIDARGTGASFGVWEIPLSADELRDYFEVADWVIGQPWSSGVLGAVGHSYEGSTAQSLAAHPAVKAVVARHMEFDIYADLLLPGGIFNEAFSRFWNEWNHGLDRNDPFTFGWIAGLFVRGARPVDADTKGELLRAAIAEHAANADVYEAINDITFRDDPYGDHDLTVDDLSVFGQRTAIEQTGAAIMGWGSWLDAATADTVIRRFMTFDNPQQAVIGAWTHEGDKHGSPYGRPKSSPRPPRQQQWDDMRSFLDHALRDGRPVTEKVLNYYTLGAETWRQTTVWPVQGCTMQRWYLADDHALGNVAPTAEAGADSYAVDFEATTGKNNRWYAEFPVPIVYKDRARADRRLLTYTSAPLDRDVEITGYPVVTLYVSSTAEDGAFFVYLEDVDSSGKVIYVTEGMLRALHRKVSPDAPPYWQDVPYHSFKREDALPLVPNEVAELRFGLLPTSVLIRRGHRLRVAIAGHDRDTFTRIPAQGIPVISVQRNRVHPSCVDLPVIVR